MKQNSWEHNLNETKQNIIEGNISIWSFRIRYECERIKNIWYVKRY